MKTIEYLPKSIKLLELKDYNDGGNSRVMSSLEIIVKGMHDKNINRITQKGLRPRLSFSIEEVRVE